MKDSTHIALLSQQIEDMYTVFISNNIHKSKEFYATWFGFETIFESTWFVLLQSPGEKKFSIAFMGEDHPSFPPAPKAMRGDGAFLTLQVADAAKVFDAMKKAGMPFSYQLKDEEWGQRRFAIVDPAGMHVDVVQQVEPGTGYWDKYMLSE